MKILRLPQVCDRTGLSSEHIRRLGLSGGFPEKFKLIPGTGRTGAVGWIEDEIEDWISERAASRDVVEA